MKTLIPNRWAAVAAGVVVLLGATAVWGLTRADRRDAPPQAEAHTMEMEGMEGMDMGGMRMGDGTVTIDPRVAASLGITTAPAELGDVRREIRTTGNVAFDETRLSTVTPKFGGFVERLHVDFTGQAVRRGQPLLEIYSPELVSAQEELLAAIRLERQLAASAAPGVAERTGGLVEAARRRLLLWDISAEQVRQIESTGEVRRTLTLYAPFAGFVVEKSVQNGQSVAPGQALYRLAALDRVWVEADVYEQDLRFVRVGEPVVVELSAYPGERFDGVVGYLYPDVRPDTRTARVRVQLANPSGRIKPGMFATVLLDAPVADRAVLVPRDAVMRTGTRDLVFVRRGAGVFETREVQVGAAAGDRVQILTGVEPGEHVVARANFILDAESRLMETMMGQPGMSGMEGMEMDGMKMDGMKEMDGMQMDTGHDH